MLEGTVPSRTYCIATPPNVCAGVWGLLPVLLTKRVGCCAPAAARDEVRGEGGLAVVVAAMQRSADEDPALAKAACTFVRHAAHHCGNKEEHTQPHNCDRQHNPPANLHLVFWYTHTSRHEP